MAHQDALNANSKPMDSCCLSCLSSFGISQNQTPHKCINTNCGRQYCRQCVNETIIYNGPNRPYRCMHCLKTYPKNKFPEENDLLYQQLYREAVIKYGVKQTDGLLSRPCTYHALRRDIECRQSHLHHLNSVRNRYLGHSSVSKQSIIARNMAGQLSDLVEYIDRHKNTYMDIAKSDYRKAISSSDDANGFVREYIILCEDLQLEISNAEQQSLFPAVYEIIEGWSHQQGMSDKFEPKVTDLFQAIQKDLINQLTNPVLASRVKIGMIGYTCAGKSTLINRALGIKSLNDDGTSLVSENKSTYFPWLFDRSAPLVDPTDPRKKTLVTLVDLQDVDENRTSNSTQMSAGNYLDEIRKADCDIYVIVYQKVLSDEQREWIRYIKETLKRQYVLVRSKIDLEFLEKFYQNYGQYYSQMDRDERIELTSLVLEELRQENDIDLGDVYLVSCNYRASNVDAATLQKDHPFDFFKLLDGLAKLAAATHLNRIHTLATRTVVRVINTCFRRGYILNSLKFKVGAGVASIIPFLDQLPRYLARDSIRTAYGIDDKFHDYLRKFDLTVHQYKLQTSVFKKSVKLDDNHRAFSLDGKAVGKTVGTALIVMGGTVLDDILRAVAPTVTLLSGVGRIIFTTATLGVGAVITLGVSVWSAVDSGKHIFSYVNRLCDDLIMITNEYVFEILLREQTKRIKSETSETNA